MPFSKQTPLPLLYFRTGVDPGQITHYRVRYQEGFVQQAWLRPEIQLYIVCIARKKGALRDIQGGLAVLTDIEYGNDVELAKAFGGIIFRSGVLRPLVGNSDNTFIPARIHITRDTPPTEEELISIFYQQCLKHGSWSRA
ncbi:hypothetical protein EVY18_15760 [Citrobacter freundii]|nr:hypothetical protein EVY23_16665 [Citrobacter freundii]RZA83065.1 hypothetical protein EVY18_15760 [Citrobacter freundii]